MKRTHTTQELDMLSAKERMDGDIPSGLHPFSGNPAAHTILRHIHEGHLSHVTLSMVLLLVIAVLAFGVYFVSSDSEAVQQAQAMLSARKASSVQP